MSIQVPSLNILKGLNASSYQLKGKRHTLVDCRFGSKFCLMFHHLLLATLDIPFLQCYYTCVIFFFQFDKSIIISFLWFKLCVIFCSFRTLGNQLHDEVSKQVKAFVETQSKARKTVDIFSKPITLLVLLEKSTKKRDCSNFWFY